MSELNNGDVTDVLDSFFKDYAIDDYTDEVNVRELMQQRTDMNKAVNKWYEKAKAFDAYHSIITKHIEQQYSHNKHDMVKRFVKIHDEYESGEYYEL